MLPIISIHVKPESSDDLSSSSDVLVSPLMLSASRVVSGLFDRIISPGAFKERLVFNILGEKSSLNGIAIKTLSIEAQQTLRREGLSWWQRLFWRVLMIPDSRGNPVPVLVNLSSARKRLSVFGLSKSDVDALLENQSMVDVAFAKRILHKKIENQIKESINKNSDSYVIEGLSEFCDYIIAALEKKEIEASDLNNSDFARDLLDCVKIGEEIRYRFDPRQADQRLDYFFIKPIQRKFHFNPTYFNPEFENIKNLAYRQLNKDRIAPDRAEKLQLFEQVIKQLVEKKQEIINDLETKNPALFTVIWLKHELEYGCRLVAEIFRIQQNEVKTLEEAQERYIEQNKEGYLWFLIYELCYLAKQKKGGCCYFSRENHQQMIDWLKRGELQEGEVLEVMLRIPHREPEIINTKGEYGWMEKWFFPTSLALDRIKELLLFEKTYAKMSLCEKKNLDAHFEEIKALKEEEMTKRSLDLQGHLTREETMELYQCAIERYLKR